MKEQRIVPSEAAAAAAKPRGRSEPKAIQRNLDKSHHQRQRKKSNKSKKETNNSKLQTHDDKQSSSSSRSRSSKPNTRSDPEKNKKKKKRRPASLAATERKRSSTTKTQPATKVTIYMTDPMATILPRDHDNDSSNSASAVITSPPPRTNPSFEKTRRSKRTKREPQHQHRRSLSEPRIAISSTGVTVTESDRPPPQKRRSNKKKHLTKEAMSTHNEQPLQYGEESDHLTLASLTDDYHSDNRAWMDLANTLASKEDSTTNHAEQKTSRRPRKKSRKRHTSRTKSVNSKGKSTSMTTANKKYRRKKRENPCISAATVALIFHYMGEVHRLDGDSAEALRKYQVAWLIRDKTLSHYHVDRAIILTCMGTLYHQHVMMQRQGLLKKKKLHLNKDEYYLDNAVQHYQCALQICQARIQFGRRFRKVILSESSGSIEPLPDASSSSSGSTFATSSLTSHSSATSNCSVVATKNLHDGTNHNSFCSTTLEEDAQRLCQIRLLLGNLFLSRQQYERARIQYQQALHFQLTQGVRTTRNANVVPLLGGLAAIHFYQHEYKEAATGYQQMWDVQRRLLLRDNDKGGATNDNGQVGATLFNLAVTYQAQRHYSRALSYYQQALKIWQVQNIPDDPRVTHAEEYILQCKTEREEKAEQQRANETLQKSALGSLSCFRQCIIVQRRGASTK